MPLITATLARALATAAEESRVLAPFLDDLDGWDGHDCDTGTNAHRTLRAMSSAVGTLDPFIPFAQGLEVAVDAGIDAGVGHVGVLIPSLLAAWAHALDGEGVPTPVAVRRMLSTRLDEAGDVSFTPSLAVERVLSDSAAELDALGQTVPDLPELVNLHASQVQYALVEATSSDTGRIDAGAAVLALLVTSLDAAVRDDTAMLTSLAHMLADLAAAPGAAFPCAHVPEADRAFTLDLLLEGSTLDARRLRRDLADAGAHLSSIGRADALGLGRWRFHLDTAHPRIHVPRTGAAVRFEVSDARPDELIGLDTLSDGVTHRGVRLLERRPMRRVERAHVVVLTEAPGLLEDFAHAGARVLLSPTPDDAPHIADLLGASSTGVGVLITSDAHLGEIARTVCTHAAAGRVHHVDAGNDLTALHATLACATLFVPQPGGPEVADVMWRMQEQALRGAAASEKATGLANDGSDLDAALEEIERIGPARFRLLLSRDADPSLALHVRQTLEERHGFDGDGAAGVDLTVLDGQMPGHSLLEGLR